MAASLPRWPPMAQPLPHCNNSCPPAQLTKATASLPTEPNGRGRGCCKGTRHERAGLLHTGARLVPRYLHQIASVVLRSLSQSRLSGLREDGHIALQSGISFSHTNQYLIIIVITSHRPANRWSLEGINSPRP